MEKLELDKSELLKAYNAANSTGKALLEKLYGKQVFELTAIQKIKTFEDACKAIGVIPAKVFAKSESKDEIAYKKLKVIVKALNGTWKPDWDNSKQAKWWPWWNMEKGFTLYDVYDFYTHTSVGSRLCYCSREVAEYAAKQFIAIYKDYIV